MLKSKPIRSTIAVLALGTGIAAAHAAPFTAEEIAQRALERRAVEAVVWAMPAVNFELMYQQMLAVGGKPNQVVYWSNLLDWKNQTLTPNPDTIYLMPFYDTKEVGPVVLEIPPAEGGSITGSIDDGWQNALQDVGPAGADKGKGGKYLILPPGYAEPVPEGYIALPSETYRGFALLRSIFASASAADIAAAVDYGKRVRMYPLSAAGNPPETVFVDALGKLFDANIPYDERYFAALDAFVQHEPWIDRDKAMIDPLKTIGIAQGEPFAPDARTRTTLKAAAEEAHAFIEQGYEKLFAGAPYYEGAHWAVPASPDVVEGLGSFFSKPGVYPTDARGVSYSMGYFSAKKLGAGQFYLMTYQDKDGQGLDGSSTYRLSVPADAPVEQYWSATVYDRGTHALVRDVERGSRSSQGTDLQKNPDGSVDVFFGPAAPAGKEGNWVPTKAGADFEVLFRLYGPTKPLFDKTWVLPDIEKVE